MITTVVTLVCLVLLVAVVAALLFDFRGFREFALHPSPQGTASLGGFLTVRGGVLLLLTATIGAGATLPLWNSGADEATTGQDETRLITELRQQVEDLQESVEDLRSVNGTLATVESWGPDESAARERLEQMASDRVGPWSLRESEELEVAVPGGIEAGMAAGCRQHYERRLELFGDGMRDTVTVQVGTLMYSASNCRQITGFDLKLSCADAHRLFGDSVLTCEGLDPRWPTRAATLTVHSVEIR